MINKAILKECCSEGFTEKELYDSYKIFFGTLNSEPRLRIINFLRKGKKNVSEIMGELTMDQTSVSHNLARLKECGFVNVDISGKFRDYSLNEKTILPLIEIIEKHMSQYCIHILRAMKGDEIK
ncbi:MAG: metalloregulator ArsR/SmtB family transcription factor [Nanoarchaeota archaeon]